MERMQTSLESTIRNVLSPQGKYQMPVQPIGTPIPASNNRFRSNSAGRQFEQPQQSQQSQPYNGNFQRRGGFVSSRYSRNNQTFYQRNAPQPNSNDVVAASDNVYIPPTIEDIEAALVGYRQIGRNQWNMLRGHKVRLFVSSRDGFDPKDPNLKNQYNWRWGGLIDYIEKDKYIRTRTTTGKTFKFDFSRIIAIYYEIDELTESIIDQKINEALSRSTKTQ